jgi:hypothetical protein
MTMTGLKGRHLSDSEPATAAATTLIKKSSYALNAHVHNMKIRCAIIVMLLSLVALISLLFWHCCWNEKKLGVDFCQCRLRQNEWMTSLQRFL